MESTEFVAGMNGMECQRLSIRSDAIEGDFEVLRSLRKKVTGALVPGKLFFLQNGTTQMVELAGSPRR